MKQTVLVFTHPSYSVSYSPLLDMGGENQQTGVIKIQKYNAFVGQSYRIKIKKLFSVLIMWQMKKKIDKHLLKTAEKKEPVKFICGTHYYHFKML